MSTRGERFSRGFAGRRGGRGFTLLEVLVALLILAIALVALVRAAALEARALTQVRDATLAQWVAANVLAEVRLSESQPAPGRRRGEADMGGRRWRWVMDVAATEEPSIQRLDVAVFVDDAAAEARDEAQARLSGFTWQ